MWVECILPSVKVFCQAIVSGLHCVDCPIRSLNSATASILASRSAMSESATVHCFSVVRALSSLNLEVWKAGYVGECHCPLFLLYVGECHCPLFLLGAISESATVHCFSFAISKSATVHCF
ncbi:unnamed protein product [Rodentolepis nana]|uniref:Secreted protein n=1 Tax=Rodentolepis nana TaxID=102285 RepID=A0A0R3T580_RODNA|nr:unnamed protein product [Rodentolepis nana]